MTIAVLEALTFGLGRLAAAAGEAGERLCLLTGNREIYRHELDGPASDALTIVDVDTRDVARCSAVLSALPDLRGLINSTDTWLVAGAELAARHGLPGTDPATARLIRDKLAVRRLLHARGLSHGTAVAVPPDATAETVRRAVGLPAVLKDSAGTGSRNVWLVRDAGQLGRALAEAATRSLMGRLFAEPYFTGTLYSAETLSWAGRTRLLGVTGRLLSARRFGREEVLSFPAMLPAADLTAIERWAGEVLAAVGHGQGFAHVEFVLTTGGPELVEINARIGGCLAGEAMCRSLGVNVYAAMIDMALGRAPALLDAPLDPAATMEATATVLVYPDGTGTLAAVEGVKQPASHPGAPEWYPTMAIGTRVADLGDQRACAGLLLATGPTTELALYNALSAARAVRPVMADGS
ncbi:argininosuccinate lyase [Sphaerisporangium melleum]|uniref:Argininosuccinate lyase n=1 Tax=Sphaerisporangium melleum TaxID=321316 RepID=A0A917QXW9_9ACTN|nr:ATP-grasp domain-containing protein [Sphaerisporangium melleum]GGK74624.1 argininosuccinate lyase [Sphaerisporangium melleum]GII70943.1 argininosuccinate lyase [Sphaerisporangium melleum]